MLCAVNAAPADTTQICARVGGETGGTRRTCLGSPGSALRRPGRDLRRSSPRARCALIARARLAAERHGSDSHESQLKVKLRIFLIQSMIRDVLSPDSVFKSLHGSDESGCVFVCSPLCISVKAVATCVSSRTNAPQKLSRGSTQGEGHTKLSVKWSEAMK